MHLGPFPFAHSNPLIVFDWIYFRTADGLKFLHYSNIVHKYSEDVILKRRAELLKVTIV